MLATDASPVTGSPLALLPFPLIATVGAAVYEYRTR